MRMNKQLCKRILCVLLAMMLFGSLLIGPDMTTFAATKYRLSRTKTTLYIGDSETLALLPATTAVAKKVKWTSSGSAIVAVKKGIITAKKAGKATVTAKLFGKKYTCKVTVKAPQVTYVDVTDSIEPETGNQIYQKDVTKSMTVASYWYKKWDDRDTLLLNQKQIAEQNDRNFKAGNLMTDLKNAKMTVDGVKLKESLSKELMEDVLVGRIGEHKVFRNGVELDKAAIEAWFAGMKKNIEDASVTAESTRKYGICVKRADLFMAPAAEWVGWSATDADSELINSSLNVNEPMLIDYVTADGKFYHVTGINCPGWIEADRVAICDSKEEWLDQWNLTTDEVLVVTGSHITLEQSNLEPETSAVDLYLGTQLPLVPEAKMPTQVAERYPWYSYSVYLPTRDENGRMKKSVALISSHHDVSIGFPKLTVRNILTVAFSCLGDRYGWGGMLGAMDCSLYTRNIYRCFGLEIPRNTTGQRAMAAQTTDLSAMELKDKAKAIAKLTPGSLLLFTGHVTMYLGTVNGKAYVISDLGSLAESSGELDVKSIYTVSINSLDVRRRSGKTWLESMEVAISPFLP